MSKTSEKSVDLTAKPLMFMSGHKDDIRKIAYLPGGERIVTSSFDKTVRIWNVENGEQEGTTMEHKGWVSGLAVTRDGKRILSGGYDKRISVWDVETHELIEEWENETGGICALPCHRMINWQRVGVRRRDRDEGDTGERTDQALNQSWRIWGTLTLLLSKRGEARVRCWLLLWPTRCHPRV
jgi:hypothetical protein